MTESEILYLALGSRFGVELRVSDFDAIQIRLRNTIKGLQDPQLALLEIRRCEDPQILWIVRKTPPTVEILGETPDAEV